MKIYVVIRSGANWWGNHTPTSSMTFMDDTKIWVGEHFYKLKDAKKYLKTLSDDSKYFQIVKYVAKEQS